jgi:hypothetical protein
MMKMDKSELSADPFKQSLATCGKPFNKILGLELPRRQGIKNRRRDFRNPAGWLAVTKLF